MTDVVAIVPILIVTLSGVAVMLAEAFRRAGEDVPGGLGLIGLAGAALASVMLWGHDASAFGVVRSDNFALFINMVLAVTGVLTIILSDQVMKREGLPAGDYHALLLFGLAGMMLMAAATDLLVIVLALEVLSLSVYVMTGMRRDRVEGAEGAFKYFLLGAFSSAFFIYGVALVFAVTGSTRLDQVGSVLAAQAMESNVLALLAVGLLLVGFAFKVAAVPFHMWAPDAYEAAPTVVTGFMATAVKAAAFAAFARVFLSALEPLRPDWAPVLWAVAVATMVLGTVVGVAQTNLKRMLAYSSIAHAGYLLIGIVASSATGKAALLFYLMAYAVTNLGAFGIMALLGTREKPNEDLRDYAGLWHTRPALAGLMTVFLLSLGGFPPTAGFIGKWYIFTAAVQEGYYGLAIIGVLTSVVSVFFYLRIVVMMYMSDERADVAAPALSAQAAAALALACLLVFYLGVLPGGLLELAAASVGTIY